MKNTARILVLICAGVLGAIFIGAIADPECSKFGAALYSLSLVVCAGAVIAASNILRW